MPRYIAWLGQHKTSDIGIGFLFEHLSRIRQKTIIQWIYDGSLTILHRMIQTINAAMSNQARHDCAAVQETVFYEILKNKTFNIKTNLSIIRTNICSLQKHCEDIDQLLDNLDHRFSVIALTETWHSAKNNEAIKSLVIEEYQEVCPNNDVPSQFVLQHFLPHECFCIMSVEIED